MIANKLRLLVITNESSPDSAPGQKDAINLLVEKNIIASVQFVSFLRSKNPKSNFQEILAAVSTRNFDMLMIWSPYFFPSTHNEFEQLIQKIAGRPIVYWEGDPWANSGLKSWTEQTKWWASVSETVFSVAKEPHTSAISKYSKGKVVFIPHTYCHVQFSSAEVSPPGHIKNSKSVIMIGNQSAKIPFIYGTEGSGIRYLAALSLKLRLRSDFHLYGKNWPRIMSSGTVTYSQQAEMIRRYSISANWDNFTSHESYASDRLPISLLAGRVHVTSAHPGTNYYGNSGTGLYQVSSIFEFHSKIMELRAWDPRKLYESGLRGHEWVKNRLSHRQAAHFMFSKILDEVPRIQFYPWSDL